MGPGRGPRKYLETTPLQSKESALFHMKRVLKTYVHSFAENGRGPDPHNPSSS